MPFVYNGGQQHNIALTILLITYILVNNRQLNLSSILLIISFLPLYYLSGGRAGMIGLLLFISFLFLKRYLLFYLLVL